MHEKLTFEKNGAEYMKLCIDVTAYWTGSVFEHAEGVLHFYFTALRALGSAPKYYATEDMGPYERIGSDTLDMLPQWLARPERSRDILTLSLESSENPDLPSDMALHFWAVEYPKHPAGMIRLVLPAQFGREAPNELIELAKRLVTRLALHSASGGYSINWDHKGRYATTARKEMTVISRRYPAIDLPDPAATLIAIPFGIKRINWLTFIGSMLAERLGGAAVSDSIVNEARVHLESGPRASLYVAGPAPSTGDVNRQENLDSYKAVGHALAPIRAHNHPTFLFKGRVPDEETTDEWLGYFD